MENNHVGKNLATLTSDISLSKTTSSQATSTYNIALLT